MYKYICKFYSIFKHLIINYNNECAQLQRTLCLPVQSVWTGCCSSPTSWQSYHRMQWTPWCHPGNTYMLVFKTVYSLCFLSKLILKKVEDLINSRSPLRAPVHKGKTDVTILLTSLQSTSRTGPVCVCWAFSTILPDWLTSQHRTCHIHKYI